MSRVVSWFSCGAPSAVATRLAIAGGEPVTVAYCHVKEEHPDNLRFLLDCERWFGQPVQIVGNDKYNHSIFEVFKSQKFISSVHGAPCTKKLKKEVRKAFTKPDDRQILGYTVEEQDRADRFIDANPDVDFWPILIEHGLTREDCLAMVSRADIELPAMYRLGYKNNNCIGCVKGGLGYWNKIKIDFPDEFDRMARLEADLGATICKIDKRGPNGERISERIPLTELPPTAGDYSAEMDYDCGIFCLMAEQNYAY